MAITVCHNDGDGVHRTTADTEQFPSVVGGLTDMIIGAVTTDGAMAITIRWSAYNDRWCGGGLVLRWRRWFRDGGDGVDGASMALRWFCDGGDDDAMVAMVMQWRCSDGDFVGTALPRR